MEIFNTLAPILKIVLSFVVGIIGFYLLVSEEEVTQKKQQVEEVTSQLINFVIFVWISKIVLKFSVFVKDPMAVLAYPSNSSAFYLAVLISVGTLAWKAKRQKIDIILFLHAFMQIFLMASFVYEFIQVVWDHNPYSIWYMALLALLFIVFLVSRSYIATPKLMVILLMGWSVGVLALTLTLPITTVFGYTMAPWFLVLVLLSCLGLVLFMRRKKVL